MRGREIWEARVRIIKCKLHDTYLQNCQSPNGILFFKKVSNVRGSRMLTNMESLGIWKWILGLSINPWDDKKMYKKIKRKVGKNSSGNAWKFLSACFSQHCNISFLFRECEITWFSFASCILFANWSLYQER